jgi:hypothetical protein
VGPKERFDEPDLTITQVKNLEQEMLTINQIAKKLVSCHDDQAPILNVGDKVKFQVISGLVQTFRCNVKSMQTPIKFKIEYFEQQNMDLDIYYSFIHSNPTKSNCEKLIKTKPKSLYITNGSKFFDTHFVYLCFQSDKGCMLEIEFLKYTNQNSLLSQFHQKQAMSRERNQKEIIIPKTDPYYLEMIDQDKIKAEKIKRRKKSRDIFNHPNL